MVGLWLTTDDLHSTPGSPSTLSPTNDCHAGIPTYALQYCKSSAGAARTERLTGLAGVFPAAAQGTRMTDNI